MRLGCWGVLVFLNLSCTAHFNNNNNNTIIIFVPLSDTTSHNPQFHVQIPRAGLSKCHVVVSVTQQYETSLSSTISSLNSSPSNTLTNNSTVPISNNISLSEKKKKAVLHPIGFAVYEVPANLTRLTPTFVSEHVRKINYSVWLMFRNCIFHRL